MTRIMMRSALCLLALTWNTPVQSFQIVPATQAIGCPRVSVSYFSSLGCLQAKRSFEDEEEESMSIPQLPAFGASSFSNSHVDFSTSMSPSPKSDNPDTAFVTPKFKLQYTCNVCETRNSHMVSRLAYREGVVIAICKGCKSKHLIADNLNETPGMNGGTNIEEYFKAKGMEDAVNRVSPEVFALENILRFDSASGSLVGDDGNPVLE